MNANHRDEKVVRLCTVYNLVEHTMYKKALEDAGIECMDTPYVTLAYNGLFKPSMGYADIYVFESEREEALKVIDAVKAQKLEAGEQDESKV